MSNYIDLLESYLAESSPPPTDYGYWINPSGDFIVIDGPSGHLRYIRMATGGMWNDYGDALNNGWIRVVSRTNHEGMMQLSVNVGFGTSARAAGALKTLARSQHYINYTIDCGEGDGYEWKSFSELQPFLAFYNSTRYRDRQPVNEAAIPMADYGYWIDPRGRAIPVSHQRHEEELAKVTHGDLVNYWEAYAEGWLRVVTDKGRLFIETWSAKYLSAAVMGTLRRLATREPFSSFIADVSNGEDAVKQEFSTPAAFLQCVTRVREEGRRALKK